VAIVTRGPRRPFQMARGLDRLLDAYAAAGGDPHAASDPMSRGPMHRVRLLPGRPNLRRSSSCIPRPSVASSSRQELDGA
jgi:hypothetical protein